MVILGAGGFAKEILQVVEKIYAHEEIYFYDDTDTQHPPLLFNKFQILRSKEALKAHFALHGSDFVIGLGKPKIRQYMATMAQELGGTLATAIDENATIGKYSTIAVGATILSQACVSNAATIGKAPLIYYNAVVTHDCQVGDFVELSPGATLLGKVRVGDFTHIGSNATVFPNVTIGSNCIVSAGAVVTKDVPDNAIVAGSPARFLKNNL